MPPASRGPIPVTVLTGFLGAGKTTLLNRLLKDPSLADTAVIINEFGDVAIDHLLVESAADGIVELGGGCICCSVRGELIDTLLDLLRRDERSGGLARVVIETTGLADPGPILQSLMGHPALLQAFRLDGVVTCVDAVNGARTLDDHVEAVKQAAMADRLVLTKLDLAGPDGAAALAARLRRLNPNAAVLDVREVGAGVLRCGLYDPETKSADVRRWLGEVTAAAGDGRPPGNGGDAADLAQVQEPTEHEHASHRHGEEGAHAHAGHDHAGHGHDGRVRALSLSHAAPLPFAALETLLHLLRASYGEHLLRLKGIVELAEDPAHPLVVHGVQGLFHPPARLPAWPDATRGARLVVIGLDLPADHVRRLWAAVTGQPSLDTPDRAALQENPLAIAESGRLR